MKALELPSLHLGFPRSGPLCVLEFLTTVPLRLTYILYPGPPRSGSPNSVPPLHHDVHLPLKDGCSLPGKAKSSWSPNLTDTYLSLSYTSLISCKYKIGFAFHCILQIESSPTRCRTCTACNCQARRSNSPVHFVASSSQLWQGDILLWWPDWSAII